MRRKTYFAIAAAILQVTLWRFRLAWTRTRLLHFAGKQTRGIGHAGFVNLCKRAGAAAFECARIPDRR